MIGRARLVAAVIAAGICCLAGCSGEPAGGPPDVVYGSDVCAECNMILNDERMDSAIVVEGPRGPKTMLFDDIGDQLIFEKRNAAHSVLERWVRDVNTGDWIDADEATFLQSPNLRTPMASGIVAFSASQAAQARLDELDKGQVYSRIELWAIPDP